MRSYNDLLTAPEFIGKRLRKRGKRFVQERIYRIGLCLPILDEQDSDLRSLRWACDKYGYPWKSVRGKRFSAHRAVGARIAGRPLLKTEIIDHINGNTFDCTRKNLRITTMMGNSQHRPNVIAPFRGTTRLRNGKWQAYVRTSSKYFYLGCFVNRDEAAAASKAKRLELGFLGEKEPK